MLQALLSELPTVLTQLSSLIPLLGDFILYSCNTADDSWSDNIVDSQLSFVNHISSISLVVDLPKNLKK